jgi:hypothetical protein
MLVEAATFGVASYLHRGGRIALGFTTVTGEHFSNAALPEAIIGAVLAAAAVFVLAAPGRARSAAYGATGFATLGVVVGLSVVVGSSRPAADLAYHVTILVVLLASALMLSAWGPARHVHTQRNPV